VDRNGKRSVYFLCDFNGRWLKDSSFLSCIDILLSVEGIIIYVIKIGCFLELVSLHFF
jgi:hypothetical protein